MSDQDKQKQGDLNRLDFEEIIKKRKDQIPVSDRVSKMQAPDPWPDPPLAERKEDK